MVELHHDRASGEAGMRAEIVTPRQHERQPVQHKGDRESWDDDDPQPRHPPQKISGPRPSPRQHLIERGPPDQIAAEREKDDDGVMAPTGQCVESGRGEVELVKVAVGGKEKPADVIKEDHERRDRPQGVEVLQPARSGASPHPAIVTNGAGCKKIVSLCRMLMAASGPPA
jgi:hypothetical protein